MAPGPLPHRVRQILLGLIRPAAVVGALLASAQSSPSPLSAAVALLATSKDAAQLASAAASITLSSDDAAWAKLREFLTDTDRIKPLEVAAVRGESVTPSQAVPHFSAIMRAIATAAPERANPNLLWLAEQPPYKLPSGSRYAYLPYDAFQYLKAPDKAVFDFYRAKLDPQTASQHRDLIMNALVAHGTPEAFALYDQYRDAFGKPYMLLTHRNQFEAFKRFVEDYKKAKTLVEARALVDAVVSDRYYLRPTLRELPPFSPPPADAPKFATLLEDLRDAPVEFPPAPPQLEKLNALIAKFKAAPTSAPTPAP